jgi:queuine tRNA-ribosyltransferase
LLPLTFSLLKKDATGARAGMLHTRRGDVPTPVFMPVATQAAFRHLSMEEAAAAGARVVLANTYHLMLQPGADVFRRMGGIHAFMQWQGPVLTDSGGFQIFSLANERQLTEKGAHFRSHHDNSRQLLSPETSIAMQQAIGSDIMMVLDVCIPSTSDVPTTRDAMERTHRWALRSLAARNAVPSGQALFAIVQGGMHHALREESAGFLTQHPFDGFAIGGLAVGEGKAEREAMTAHTTRLLPEEKPRYLMGVGTPLDLVEGVLNGVDMFDCIMPTKHAQQGYAHTFGEGLLLLSRPRYRLSTEPLDASCDCSTCARFSRGYIQHLLRGKDALGLRLLSVHNVRHYQVVMRRLRDAILEDTLEETCVRLRQELAPPRRTPESPVTP